ARVAEGLQSAHDASGRATASAWGVRFDAQARVEADVHYDCTSSVPAAALAAAGLAVSGTAHLPPLCVVEGWVDPAALPKLTTVSGVTRVKVPSYARHVPRPTLKSTAAPQAGRVIDGNALSIMRADQFQALGGAGGRGVIVGVQS